MYFRFFTNAMECERGKQDFNNFLVFLMQEVSLYFNTKIAGKRITKKIIQLVYFNYYKGKSAKEIADMFSLKIRTAYHIPCKDD